MNRNLQETKNYGTNDTMEVISSKHWLMIQSMDDNVWSDIFLAAKGRKKCCIISDHCSGRPNWLISKIFSSFYWWKFHLKFEAKFMYLCQYLVLVKGISIRKDLQRNRLALRSYKDNNYTCHCSSSTSCENIHWDYQINRLSLNF